MKYVILSCLFGAILLSTFSSQAQSVGIGTETPNSNAVLELVASDNDQGLLVPRLTTLQRTAASFTANLSTTDNGLLVYDEDENKFFFWINDQWLELASGNLNGLPDQIGQGGKFLSSDGSTALWTTLDFSSLANIPLGLSDGDDNTQLTDTEITALGFIKDANDADNDPTNENQTVQGGTGISVSQSGQDFTVTNTSPDQTVALGDGGNGNVTIGGTYPNLTVDVPDNLDNSSSNELQDLTLAGSTLSLTSSSIDIDLSPFSGTNTDNQTIGLSGTDLSISGGNTIDISSVDTDTQLSDGAITALGYIKNADDADANPSNEIQDISFDGTNLSISSGSTINLTALQDGTGTDNQVAGEVNVTAGGDLTSGDVQSALEELQSEIVAAASAAIPDNAVTTPKLSNGAVTNAKVSDVAFSKLTSVPSGLSDGDDDTQLDEATVDAFVSDNGYLTTVNTVDIVAGAVTNAKINSMTFSKLTGVPSGLADGDDDTQLDETAVDAFVSDNGYLTTVNTSDIASGAVTNVKINSVAFSKLTGVPTGLADGDNDTQLNEAAVDAFVADNGYLSSESDPTVPANIKDGIDWTELSGIPADIADGDDDTNTQLNEAAVDAFVSDNGYLTTVNTADIASGAVTNVKISSVAFSKLTSVPSGLADGDDDTQLDEVAVDAFVANNGYLTSVSTTDITNGTIVNADISNSAAISGTKLASNTVTATQIATNGVGTSEILNSTILNADISASAAISGTKLANNTITATQIAASGVATSEILNGTILNADISGSAAIAGTKISPNFGSQSVTGGSFNYSTAETRTYSVSPVEFVALKGIVEPNTIAFSSSGGEAFSISGNASNVQRLSAPLRIPDGSIITRVVLYARNSSSTATVNINLVQNSMNTATSSTLLAKMTPSTTSITAHDSGTISYSISQGSFSYQLAMEADVASASGFSVAGAVITYTVSSPD